jgi:hypothetical protein
VSRVLIDVAAERVVDASDRVHEQLHLDAPEPTGPPLPPGPVHQHVQIEVAVGIPIAARHRAREEYPGEVGAELRAHRGDGFVECRAVPGLHRRSVPGLV